MENIPTIQMFFLYSSSPWSEQEALHREQMLEQKLAGLQRLISATQEASENSWQALIDEDRLLSRLEVLESQLRAYSKVISGWSKILLSFFHHLFLFINIPIFFVSGQIV